MHALQGTPSKASTFTLKLHFGDKTTIALVDSGNDASFINAKFAIRSKCPLVNIEPVRITAANGLEMISDTSCLNIKYTVQGHEFTTNFRLLEV